MCRKAFGKKPEGEDVHSAGAVLRREYEKLGPITYVSLSSRYVWSWCFISVALQLLCCCFFVEVVVKINFLTIIVSYILALCFCGAIPVAVPQIIRQCKLSASVALTLQL